MGAADRPGGRVIAFLAAFFSALACLVAVPALPAFVRMSRRRWGPRLRALGGAGGPALERALPDFLDLLALALTAGLPFSRAWRAAIDWMPAGPLRDRLSAVPPERDPSRAVAALERHGGLPPALSLLLRTAAAAGAPVGEALSAQAAHLRAARLARAERAAQTASIRLLFPLVFLMLPAVLLAALGPACAELMGLLGAR